MKTPLTLSILLFWLLYVFVHLLVVKYFSVVLWNFSHSYPRSSRVASCKVKRSSLLSIGSPLSTAAEYYLFWSNLLLYKQSHILKATILRWSLVFGHEFHQNNFLNISENFWRENRGKCCCCCYYYYCYYWWQFIKLFFDAVLSTPLCLL
jgi:hypothetical protein